MAVADEANTQLNPALWSGSALRPSVRAHLLKIARDFIDNDAKVAKLRPLDIVITGSSANYNWTPSSDIDLHIIVDPAKVGCPSEITSEFLYDLTALWNEHHKIFILGHPVEIFIQDASEHAPYAAGVYSLVKREWVQEPVRVVDPDASIVRKKADVYADRILKLIARTGSSQSVLDGMKEIRDRLSLMRRAALTSRGEHSVENLVFKELRRRGLIDRLKLATRATYDDLMTLREAFGSRPVPGLHLAETLTAEFDRMAWG